MIILVTTSASRRKTIGGILGLNRFQLLWKTFGTLAAFIENSMQIARHRRTSASFIYCTFIHYKCHSFWCKVCTTVRYLVKKRPRWNYFELTWTGTAVSLSSFRHCKGACPTSVWLRVYHGLGVAVASVSEMAVVEARYWIRSSNRPGIFYII